MSASRNYWAPGQNNVYCQVCNKKMKAFEAKRKYDNLTVCSDCWNPRHPQEYAADIRPELPPSIIAVSNEVIVPQCDIYSSQAIPGIGIPGCLTPGVFYLGAQATSLPGEAIPVDE